jgi:hypothetical protein
MAHAPVIPVMQGGTNRRIAVQDSPGTKQDSISKIPNLKKAKGTEPW